jgi:hypothetical protein
MDDAAIFGDISERIRVALEKTWAVNKSRTRIAQRSFEQALQQLI